VNARLIAASSGDLARICHDHGLRVTVRLPSLVYEVDVRLHRSSDFQGTELPGTDQGRCNAAGLLGRLSGM